MQEVWMQSSSCIHLIKKAIEKERKNKELQSQLLSSHLTFISFPSLSPMCSRCLIETFDPPFVLPVGVLVLTLSRLNGSSFLERATLSYCF
mmetsp:Transcript_22927/g.56498  ORF Transcript_22927/g.56498 Transcript_22927/m.56498 type:complete len:91 (+) Transcript_22927:241-513(+)